MSIFKYNNNEPFSAWSHFFAGVISIPAIIWLVYTVLIHGDLFYLVLFSLFGMSMVFVYFTSGFFHYYPKGSKKKELFWRLDQSMIYLLIAGSFTPMAFISFRGWPSWLLLFMIWALAMSGVMWKFIGKTFSPYYSFLSYALLALFCMAVAFPTFLYLEFSALAWVLTGIFFYLLSGVFFLIDLRYKGFSFKYLNVHDVFHILVVYASFSYWYGLYRTITIGN